MNQHIKQQLIAVLRAEPRRVNMGVSIASTNDLPVLQCTDDTEYDYHPQDNRPPCGTVACIAGHLLLLDKLGYDVVAAGDFKYEDMHSYLRRWDLISIIAARILQISPLGAADLFHLQYWPRALRAEIEAFPPGSPEYTECVVRAIEIFDAAGDHWPPKELQDIIY